MCGIAGILNFDGRPCDAEELGEFTDALAHRGPDGRGFYVDGPLGLGHRRLAIIDLTDGGRQPMPYANRRYHITYNGEIYNFLELRTELETLGYQFVSDSDTEIILGAYQQWGADCVLKFNGMWAFALWDAERTELFLSRDRFGVKPLHYTAESRRFTFASELKAYRRLRGFRARPNLDEVRRSLATGGESVEDTLLMGVSQLPPGYNMLVRESSVRKWRWWHTLDHLPEIPRQFPDQAEHFRELFFDACRLRMRSDVPIATLLSGGMDSSAIVCTAASIRRNASAAQSRRVTANSHRAFVATFAGTPNDETEYAEAAIAQAGAEPHLRPMTAEDAVEHLRRYAFDFETIGVALLTPVWSIYRELRRDGVFVSLDGHGADELLTGYSSTLLDTLGKNGGLWHLPSATVDMARTVASMRGGGARDAARIILQTDPFLRGVRRRLRRGRAVARPTVEDWVAPIVERDDWMGADDPSKLAALTPFDRMLYLLFHQGSLPSILRKYDRLSMAHGIESRMPFLDWRLVCYAFALPHSSKIGGGVSKRVLRESMRGVLPDLVRERKSKIGFQGPMGSWFNGDLGDWMLREAQSKAFVESALWNGAAIRDFVAERARTRSWTPASGRRVWRYFQAHLWLENFFTESAA